MGKIVSQIPNEDPERLKRVLDAKWRTIGVRVVLLGPQSCLHACRAPSYDV